MNRTNRCAKVVNHCKTYGSITSAEAMQMYGIARLASRISDLKRLGYIIESKIESGKNRNGEMTHYARYRIVEHEN